MRSLFRALSALVLVILSPLAFAQYQIEPAFPNLSFSAPVDIQNAADGSNRLFVVEQEGVISVFPNDPNAASAKTFLDISGRVESGGEMGLLGLAFHPDYEDNGWFFVNYTAANPRRTVIAKFRRSENDPDAADPNSEEVLLEFNQPFENHNGGQVSFGPDGYLYIATGDGGSGGDPDGNGQNLTTYLGKILRIDVMSTKFGRPYGIPNDNPFVDNTAGYLEEIYAYGLRNPWRFSFDPETGWLWAADVGQSRREEIDIIEKGKNYGWNVMEGSLCYKPSTGCDTTGKVKPIYEYGRTVGVSITGGFVYRGTKFPDLQGKYIYSDYGSGEIWALTYTPGSAAQNATIVTTSRNFSSFGIDESRELYAAGYNGVIYQLRSTATSAERTPAKLDGITLSQNYPNPLSLSRNASAIVTVSLSSGGPVRLTLVDMLGRTVKTLHAGFLSAGVHNLSYSVVGLEAGNYMLQLSSGSRRASRLMTVVR